VDSSYVLPFVRSVQNVFETMLQLPVDVREPYAKKAEQPTYDVSGIIGMSGDVDGSVALSFDTATAQRVVLSLTGESLERDHEDFADAIGELVNMVAGGAKAQFEGKDVNISCPSVVVGAQHQVFARKDARHIAIPCSCDCGEFVIEVTFRVVEAAPVGGGAEDAKVTN